MNINDVNYYYAKYGYVVSTRDVEEEKTDRILNKISDYLDEKIECLKEMNQDEFAERIRLWKETKEYETCGRTIINCLNHEYKLKQSGNNI